MEQINRASSIPCEESKRNE